MPYRLHITRASDWMQSDELPITAGEWLKVVRSDPELTHDRARGDYFVRWSGSTGRERWLEWRDGRISTGYPDGKLLAKLVAIAQLLGAKVQGDGGEIYSGDEPVDAWAAASTLPFTPRSVILTQRLPWWKRIVRRRRRRWWAGG